MAGNAEIVRKDKNGYYIFKSCDGKLCDPPGRQWAYEGEGPTSDSAIVSSDVEVFHIFGVAGDGILKE